MFPLHSLCKPPTHKPFMSPASTPPPAVAPGGSAKRGLSVSTAGQTLTPSPNALILSFAASVAVIPTPRRHTHAPQSVYTIIPSLPCHTPYPLQSHLEPLIPSLPCIHLITHYTIYLVQALCGVTSTNLTFGRFWDELIQGKKGPSTMNNTVLVHR